MDVTTTVLWYGARLKEKLANLILAKGDTGSKLPYNRAGIGQVAAAIDDVNETGVRAEHFNEGEVTSIVPDIGDVSAEDKAARILRGVGATAVLSGGINKIVANLINLSLS